MASTTARQRTAPTPSRWPSPITCRVTPATPPSSASSRSTASACSMTSISGARSTAAISARWISAPVASPPAWAIRSRWWPPSRVSDSSPSGSWSKLVPSAISSRTASGPSVTRTRTASRSQAPAPATRVSTSCCSGVSPGPSAAAMPPCAHCVEPASSTSLVTTSTLPTWPRSRRAAVSPAMPEPMTTTSAVVVQPGSGAVAAREPARGRAPCTLSAVRGARPVSLTHRRIVATATTAKRATPRPNHRRTDRHGSTTTLGAHRDSRRDVEAGDVSPELHVQRHRVRHRQRGAMRRDSTTESGTAREQHQSGEDDGQRQEIPGLDTLTHRQVAPTEDVQGYTNSERPLSARATACRRD